ncbi:SSI family serine proteinase inhibitor [Haloactinomyces albus]|uniref:Subtilisin inhibitor domain-containing protein n=1 Tax=Haloactinomyces albus TaxID=1352928 RepID=A0AAE4CKK6_9ACTN|nr:SSI family serine proteinase inhibitor [Haloactinomyces albus]MDR7301195.1 hypothetical protein [Haloactinomyces albus]
MAAIRLFGRTLIATTAIAAATLASTGASAAPLPSASSEPSVQHSASVLHLTVDRGTGSDPYRAVVLTCGPAGGTHPKAASACENLDRAGGKFSGLRAGRDNAMCPLVYRPVTVTATGTWEGTPVKHEKTYSNACVLTAHTGPVFDF